MNFLEAKFERLTGATTVRSRPYILLVDVSANCQLRCPSCPTGQENESRRLGEPLRFRERGLIEPGLFSELLDELGPDLFHLLLYNWGEPFLNPKLPEFIAQARRRGITTEIHTNLAMNLSDDRLRAVLAAGIDEIGASIDGFSQESYGTYRRGGQFSLARDNLVRLAKLRTELGLRTKIVWNFLVFSFNEHEIEAAEAFCGEHGIAFQRREAAIDVDLTPEWLPSYRRHELPSAQPEDEGEAAAAVEAAPPGKEAAPVEESPTVEVEKAPSSCGWHYSFSVVNASGTISPCCAAWGQMHDVGRFGGPSASFAATWNGPELRYARSLAAGGPGLPSYDILCRACPFDDGVKDLYSFFDAKIRRHFDEVIGGKDPLLAAAFEQVLDDPGRFVDFYRENREAIEQGSPEGESSAGEKVETLAERATPVQDWTTRAFPPAEEALQRADFRVSGVFCWQGHWNYNFWSNFTVEAADAELVRLAGLHFNTGLVSLPWGVFQPQIDPPTYCDEAFAKLDLLLDRLEALRMYAILRVGSAEHAPRGIAGGSYDLHRLFLDDREIDAYAEFIAETARRLRGRSNILFLFHSWEDFQGYLGVTERSHEQRLACARETGTYQDFLRRNATLDTWNRRWGTDHESFEDVPLPTLAAPAFRDLLHFSDERLKNHVLPTIGQAVKRRVPESRLSFEVRIDPDVYYRGDGSSDWFDHDETWCLPDTYDVISFCWNGTWGAKNDGRYLELDFALANLRDLLGRLEIQAGGRPLFVDQLNVNDSTPGFSFASRLKHEDDVLEFLDDALPIIYQRTLGYAFWGLEPAASDILLNSNFASGSAWWHFESSNGHQPSIRRAEADAEPYLLLPPGTSVEQEIEAGVNPGRVTPERPLTVRCRVRSEVGGSLQLRFVTPDSGHSQSLEIGPLDKTWSWAEAAFPFAETGRLALRATGGGSVSLCRISAFNHRQDAAVLGPPGTDLYYRTEVFERFNRCWQHGWEEEEEKAAAEEPVPEAAAETKTRPFFRWLRFFTGGSG